MRQVAISYLKVLDVFVFCFRTESAMSTMNAINLEYNHEQDEKKVNERQQLRSQIKRKATEDLTPDLQKSLGLSYINLSVKPQVFGQFG